MKTLGRVIALAGWTFAGSCVVTYAVANGHWDRLNAKYQSQSVTNQERNHQ